ncbi:hypothetical protein DYB34_005110 [Aphanomyces astaci]|uniref:C2 domain-containing protein n=3 Tax=Aphanomyces astaci TaxID=112090 RepID=A0A397AF34_APHAT|nr:hypothetical protein DYB36_007204 [Aphanomyces astaci]RHY69660.1 hypothetical protein DYB34_005110 [Aphanomyces astaci]
MTCNSILVFTCKGIHMAALFGPLPAVNREAFKWVPDKDTAKCMNCHADFSMINRKAERTSEPVANSGRVRIGQLYVKVVEAIGLPSTDAIANSITSDPFVKVEWSKELQSTKLTKRKSRTLNPRWHETFVFNVCAPGAELVLEVFNAGQLTQQATKLGQATVPLVDLMDQRRHNKWLDLQLPPTLHRHGLNNDARAGRIHVLLHFKFARVAEFLSHFTAEERYTAPWPPFKAAILYNNFWILLDDLWPYLEVVWSISPTLNWDHPSRSSFVLIAVLWMCMYIEWVPVLVHVAMIGMTIKNLIVVSVKMATADSAVPTPPVMFHSSSNTPSTMMSTAAAAATSLTSSSYSSSSAASPVSSMGTGTSSLLTASASSSSSSAVGGGTTSLLSMDGGALHDDPPRVYSLPQGFHHITDKMAQVTTDAETKMTLQRVQNNMAWWSGIIKSIELMFSWEDFFYTLQIFVALVVSCVLHVFLPNQYLLMVFVVYLFTMWTVPFGLFTRAIYGLKQGLLSLLHQQRLRAHHEKTVETSRSAAAAAAAANGAPFDSSASRVRRGLSMSRNEVVSRKEHRFGAAATALSRRFAEEMNNGASAQ